MNGMSEIKKLRGSCSIEKRKLKQKKETITIENQKIKT